MDYTTDPRAPDGSGGDRRLRLLSEALLNDGRQGECRSQSQDHPRQSVARRSINVLGHKRSLDISKKAYSIEAPNSASKPSATLLEFDTGRRTLRGNHTPASYEAPLILLVDCESRSRLQDCNALLDEGYDVVESASAVEAKHILESRNDFDAMILDIDPIGTSGGLALARYAARHHVAMKVLVASAWNDAEAESVSLDFCFLAKPYLPAYLLLATRRMLCDERSPPASDEGCELKQVRGDGKSLWLESCDGQ